MQTPFCASKPWFESEQWLPWESESPTYQVPNRVYNRNRHAPTISLYTAVLNLVFGPAGVLYRYSRKQNICFFKDIVNATCFLSCSHLHKCRSSGCFLVCNYCWIINLPGWNAFFLILVSSSLFCIFPSFCFLKTTTDANRE
jgi:hypothetical protein